MSIFQFYIYLYIMYGNNANKININIIGLCGKRGSGKSTFYDMFPKYISSISTKCNINTEDIFITKLPFASFLKLISFRYFTIIFEKDVYYINKLYRHIYREYTDRIDYSLKLKKYDIIIDEFNFRSYLFTILTSLKVIYNDIRDRIYRTKIINYQHANEKSIIDMLYDEFKLLEIAYKHRDVRSFLQFLATEVCKEYIGNDIWILFQLDGTLKIINEAIKKYNNIYIFIDDLRFMEEYKYLKDIYKPVIIDSIRNSNNDNNIRNKIIDVNIYKIGLVDIKDRNKKKDKYDYHKSEMEVDKTIQYMDMVILNDKSGIDVFIPVYNILLNLN